MCKTAILLAGGLGSRLGSHTAHLPKSLLPIQGSPLLGIILHQLAKHDYKRVILALHYKSDLIKSFCEDGSKWNLCIEYSKEEQQLGTIGPIKLISTLPDNFLIMNSDILTDLDLNQFYNLHVEQKNLFTIAYWEKKEELPYGLLEIENQKLKNFQEKPAIKQMINMGIYMANRKIVGYIPNRKFFGLNDLVTHLLDLKQPVAVVPHHGKWMDIGTIQDYDRAQSAAPLFLP